MKAPFVPSHLPTIPKSREEIRQARVKAGEPRYKIAILDSGYVLNHSSIELKLCKTGHYDYFTKTANLAYAHAHGTRVASLIAEKLKDIDYCAVIYQVQHNQGGLTQDKTEVRISTQDTTDALNRAIGENVDAINYSLSSSTTDYPEENKAFLSASRSGIAVFIAAGNASPDQETGNNLDIICNYYPVCALRDEPLIFIIGAQDYNNPKEKALYSNYGKRTIDIWAPGYHKDGDFMRHGTSYAAPRALSEYILFLEHKRLHP